ncbi:phage holin, LLH family [Patescibacteria group bacterium]
MENYFSNILFELVAAVLLFILGFITSQVWRKLTKNRNEKNLKENVKVAIKIIFEAEKKFSGRKKGVQKLEYATNKLMEITNIKDYEIAQNFIIKIFNLTKLSKVDFKTTN